jgi:starvation-inducible DNA-binding protein
LRIHADGVEEVPVQISRLLETHEHIMKQARDMAGKADEAGDDGTNDLLVSQVLRVNELQSWFIVTHLVDEPLVIASDE